MSYIKNRSVRFDVLYKELFSNMSMVNVSDLRRVNPWWKSPGTINKDSQIVQWEDSNIRYDPRLRKRFDYDHDIVYSLRGPRQVGKTTLIKLQIREFLQDKISPWNVLFYTFDLGNSAQDVVDTVRAYLDLSKQQRKDNRCFLFLDEVSSIKDWQKGIKWLWDQGYLKNCTVIAAGSHTVNMEHSAERLPNRRGETTDTYDKIMLPMKFSEYISVMDPNMYEQMRKIGLDCAESRLKIFKNMIDFDIDLNFDGFKAHLDDLNRHLENYMLTGGIPRIVNAYRTNNMLESGIFTDYLNTILGELSSQHKEKTLFKQLINRVIKNISWPVSWRMIWEDTNVGSVNTAIEYMFMLCDMFILDIFYQYDTKNKQGHLNKAKKIHFQDPFFLHVLNSWNSNREPFQLAESYVENSANQGNIIEGIIGSHLIRLAFALSQNKQAFDYADFVYTWKYAKDKEVDFILADGLGMELPIEVKFKDKITPKKDLNGIYNFQKSSSASNGLLITKDLLERSENHIKIPASMFLLLV